MFFAHMRQMTCEQEVDYQFKKKYTEDFQTEINPS